VIEGGNDSSI